VKKQGKRTRTVTCSKCRETGHIAKTCSLDKPLPSHGRLAPSPTVSLGNGFVKSKRPGKPPVDEHVYGLIKDKKDGDMSASEIAEMYDIERDIVADVMIAPSWREYAERFTG
jgi:hypothetical protein